MEDGILQDHVQVGVRFVQQYHGAGPGVEQCQQHQHLLETAARARHVKRRFLPGHRVLGEDVRAGGIRGKQPIAEQVDDRGLQRFPCRFVVVRVRKQVPQHFSRTAESEKLFDLWRLQQRFIRANAGHRRHEHHGQVDIP